MGKITSIERIFMTYVPHEFCVSSWQTMHLRPSPTAQDMYLMCCAHADQDTGECRKVTIAFLQNEYGVSEEFIRYVIEELLSSGWLTENAGVLSMGKHWEPRGKRGNEPPAQGKTKTRRKATTPPPDDIPITPELQAWAEREEIHVDLVRETHKCLDYFRAKGESRADWIATWRNWMRRAGENRYSQRPSSRKDKQDGNHTDTAETIRSHGWAGTVLRA